jgi:hypothetical protein
MPLSRSMATVLRRSSADSPSVVDACMARTVSGGATQSVRRMAWCRISDRSAYRA